MADLMTQAEYARHRDVSREAVRKAIEAKRITTVTENGKVRIDPEVADIQWARNTDQKQFERANAAKIRAATPPEDAPAPPPRGREAGGGGGDAYFEARARREAAEAEKAVIELERLRGTVADTAGMRNAAFAIGRLLRDTLLGLPTKLAPEYAGMTDAFEIERHMDAALRRVLDDLASLTAQDLERPMQ